MLFYAYEQFVWIYVYVSLVCLVLKIVRRGHQDPLYLETTSYHVGPGNQTWVLCNSDKCS